MTRGPNAAQAGEVRTAAILAVALFVAGGSYAAAGAPPVSPASASAKPKPKPKKPLPPLNRVVLADRPLAYWRLGEGAGEKAVDASGKGRTGKYVGGPALRQLRARNDPAIGLDGQTQYVEVPFVQELNPPQFTIEAWARVDGGAGTFRSVVTSRHSEPGGPKYGCVLYAGNSDRWEFWVGTGTPRWVILRGGPVVPARWTHLVATYDGAAMRLYVDGRLWGPRAETYAANAASPLRIGAGVSENPVPRFFLPGAVDDVAVYHRPLPADRVLAHFRSGRSA